MNESVIVRIQALNASYQRYIERTSSFIEEHAQLDKPGNMTNAAELSRMPQMRFLLTFGESDIKNNLIPAHINGIQKCNDIMKDINKEMK